MADTERGMRWVERSVHLHPCHWEEADPLRVTEAGFTPGATWAAANHVISSGLSGSYTAGMRELTPKASVGLL